MMNSLPQLTQEIENALRDSISRYGVVVPVVLNRGELIDGHNRVRIANSLDIEYPVVNLDIEDADVLAVHLNTHRRQLDPATRKSIVASLTEAGYSQRAIAGAVGASKKTVQNDQVDTGIQVSRKTTGTDGRIYTKPKPKMQVAQFGEVIQALKAVPKTVGSDEAVGNAPHRDKVTYLKALHDARSKIDALIEQAERVTGYLGRPT